MLDRHLFLVVGNHCLMTNRSNLTQKVIHNPEKCAAEVCPPWHTTRVDYTTYP